ncbi:MAG: prenyltransferase/squalene oxidase repeat-containing protein [Candidatus Kariarchaeaceae archaeon]
MKKGFTLLILVFVLIISSVSARTRNDSVETYLDQIRLTQEGFANSPSEAVGIQSTTRALTISRLLNHRVNNTLDILLFYQRSQNEDGGFGADPKDDSNWEATISGIQGLWELRVNNTYLSQWKINEYLNATAVDLFYYETVENNQTRLKNTNLNLDLIVKWREYIFASILIGVIPPIPNIFLGSELKSYQLANGTYSTFEIAVQSIQLLNLIGQVPDKPELSTKFILAYAASDGLFSSTLNGSSTLQDTYYAIDTLDQLGRLSELSQRNKIILKILDLQKPNSGFTDINSNQVTLESTWYAVNILALLDSLEELALPDVLMTEGFVSFNSMLYFGIIIFGISLRRKYR